MIFYYLSLTVVGLMLLVALIAFQKKHALKPVLLNMLLLVIFPIVLVQSSLIVGVIFIMASSFLLGFLSPGRNKNKQKIHPGAKDKHVRNAAEITPSSEHESVATQNIPPAPASQMPPAYIKTHKTPDELNADQFPPGSFMDSFESVIQSHGDFQPTYTPQNVSAANPVMQAPPAGHVPSVTQTNSGMDCHNAGACHPNKQRDCIQHQPSNQNHMNRPVPTAHPVPAAIPYQTPVQYPAQQPYQYQKQIQYTPYPEPNPAAMYTHANQTPGGHPRPLVTYDPSVYQQFQAPLQQPWINPSTQPLSPKEHPHIPKTYNDQSSGYGKLHMPYPNSPQIASNDLPRPTAAPSPQPGIPMQPEVAVQPNALSQPKTATQLDNTEKTKALPVGRSESSLVNEILSEFYTTPSPTLPPMNQPEQIQPEPRTKYQPTDTPPQTQEAAVNAPVISQPQITPSHSNTSAISHHQAPTFSTETSADSLHPAASLFAPPTENPPQTASLPSDAAIQTHLHHALTLTGSQAETHLDNFTMMTSFAGDPSTNAPAPLLVNSPNEADITQLNKINPAATLEDAYASLEGWFDLQRPTNTSILDENFLETLTCKETHEPGIPSTPAASWTPIQSQEEPISNSNSLLDLDTQTFKQSSIEVSAESDIGFLVEDQQTITKAEVFNMVDFLHRTQGQESAKTPEPTPVATLLPTSEFPVPQDMTSNHHSNLQQESNVTYQDVPQSKESEITNCDPVQDFINKQRNLLLDRTLQKNITDRNGNVLISNGTVITAQIFDGIAAKHKEAIVEMAMYAK